MIWLIGDDTTPVNEFRSVLEKKCIPFYQTFQDPDLSDSLAVDRFSKSTQILAAKTGLSVINGTTNTKIDWVIFFPSEKNPENELSAQNVARLCRNIGAKLIFISNSFVFDGKKTVPYTETDPKHPSSQFAQELSLMEKQISNEMSFYYILRGTSFEYSNSVRNHFVQTIAMALATGDAVVDKMYVNPLNSFTLGTLILKIIEKSQQATELFGPDAALPYGIYNAGTDGKICRLSEFYNYAVKILVKTRKLPKGTKIEFKDSQEDAVNYSVNCQKLTKANKIKLPTWQEDLESFIRSSTFTF